MNTVFVLVQILISWPEVHSEVKYEVNNSFHDRLAMRVIKARFGQNYVVSPLALKFPLCKLADVATGVAKKELMAALGLSTGAMAKKCYTLQKNALQLLKERDLILLSKIYLNTSYSLNPSFTVNLTEMFGVQIDQVGFNYHKTAMNFINRWVESTTYRRIQDLLGPRDIDKNTSMVIVNAAHFKSSWEHNFDIKISKMQKFRLPNNTIVMTPMMTKSSYFQFFGDETTEFRLITLYLMSWGGTVTFVLPSTEIGIENFITRVESNPDYIRNPRKTAKYQHVKLTMPRVKIKTTIDWNEPLKQIGIRRIFSSTSSGLAGMLKTDEKKNTPYISKVKQKNFIEIDEFGVFRGSGRSFIDYMDMKMFDRPAPLGARTYDMTLDRPFLFMVCVLGGEDGHPGHPMATAQELFVGANYGPE